MARIVDLDLLTSQNIQFKIGGEVFEIPGNPPTQLTLEFMEFQDRKGKTKDPKANVESLAEMVAMILNQDDKKEITKQFVLEKFSLSQMTKIAEVFMDSVRGIESNPN